MYYAKQTQNGDSTAAYDDPWEALEIAEECGWEECETELRQVVETSIKAEFRCTYYGDYECELTSNRPDSYCEVHSA